MPAAATHAVPTRQRIVLASAELFRRQGFAGTGLKQVVTQAGAPLGSLYHFFPGGKEELADEVLRTAGAFFLALYEAIIADAPDLPAGIAAFFAGAGETLVATDYADACPIATVAGEIASTNDVLRRATAEVFESWLTALADDLQEAGAEPAATRELALAILALLEGAFLLCRATRGTEAMHASGRAAQALLSTALPQRKAAT